MSSGNELLLVPSTILAKWAAADFSSVPTSDPGSNQPWLTPDGRLGVGAYQPVLTRALTPVASNTVLGSDGLGGAVAAPITYSGTTTLFVGTGVASTFIRGSTIYLDPSGNLSDAIRVTTAEMSPYLSSTLNLGSGTTPWGAVFGASLANGTTGQTTIGNATGGVSVNGSLTGAHIQNVGTGDSPTFAGATLQNPSNASYKIAVEMSGGLVPSAAAPQLSFFTIAGARMASVALSNSSQLLVYHGAYKVFESRGFTTSISGSGTTVTAGNSEVLAGFPSSSNLYIDGSTFSFRDNTTKVAEISRTGNLTGTHIQNVGTGDSPTFAAVNATTFANGTTGQTTIGNATGGVSVNGGVATITAPGITAATLNLTPNNSNSTINLNATVPGNVNSIYFKHAGVDHYRIFSQFNHLYFSYLGVNVPLSIQSGVTQIRNELQFGYNSYTPTYRSRLTAAGHQQAEVSPDGTTWQTGARHEYNAGGIRQSVYGVTPVARQSIAAEATDAATTQTLANSIRTILINFGIAV